MSREIDSAMSNAEEIVEAFEQLIVNMVATAASIHREELVALVEKLLRLRSHRQERSAQDSQMPSLQAFDDPIQQVLTWDQIQQLKYGAPMGDVTRHQLCNMAQDRACQLQGCNPTHRQEKGAPIRWDSGR